MMPNVFCVFLCFVASFLVADASQSCANDGKFSCYSCMGRDMANCDWGEACCTGSCWKLIDEEHDIIAKGCTNVKKNSGSSEQYSANVELPFVEGGDKEKKILQGVGHFCGTSDEEKYRDFDFCNSATAPLISIATLLSLLILGYVQQ